MRGSLRCILGALLAGAATAAAAGGSQSIEPAPTSPPAHDTDLAIQLLFLLGNAVAATIFFLLLMRRRALRITSGVVGQAGVAPIYAVGFLAMFLAQWLGAGAVNKMVGPLTLDSPLREKALVMLGGYALQLPLAVALVLLLPPAPRRPWHQIRRGVLGLILVWPFMHVAAFVAGKMQEIATERPPPELGHHTLEELSRSTDVTWSMVVGVCVVVIGPALEEIAYRGALQTSLRTFGIGPWSSILVASTVFAGMHIGAIPVDSIAGALAALFVFGLALGILRERTRSLVPCVVAHALFNAVNLAIAALR